MFFSLHFIFFFICGWVDEFCSQIDKWLSSSLDEWLSFARKFILSRPEYLVLHFPRKTAAFFAVSTITSKMKNSSRTSLIFIQKKAIHLTKTSSPFTQKRTQLGNNAYLGRSNLNVEYLSIFLLAWASRAVVTFSQCLRKWSQRVKQKILISSKHPRWICTNS